MPRRTRKMTNTQMIEARFSSSRPALGSPSAALASNATPELIGLATAARATSKASSVENKTDLVRIMRHPMKAPARVSPNGSETQLQLVGQQEAEDQGGKGEPFDEGRRDDHVCADAATGLGLAGDGLDGLTADVPDALTSAE